MRCLIDTNIFVYMVSDRDSLSSDVKNIIYDWDTQLCISVESVKELVLAYRTKGLLSKHWKSPEDIVYSIENEYYIKILPIQKEHMETYARMEINEGMGHKDPSDHMIIAHAMTEKMPLISSDTRFPFYRKQGLELIVNKK